MTLSPKRADIGIGAIDAKPRFRGECRVVGVDPLEHLVVEADQVDLVDRQHHVADAEQRGDDRVAARLHQHALPGVDQHHRHVGGRGAGRHVAGVLLVAGRVGDDELALRRGEEAVGDVDGDALLALGLQPVDQQREIDVVAVGAVLLEIALQRGSWSSKISLVS